MRAKVLSVLVALPLLFAAVPAVSESSEGEIAYQRGDYVTAMAEWQSVAKTGDAMASYGIGQIYRFGKGLRYRDFEKAVYWYQRAAGRGYVAAQFELARLQFEGLMVPRDIDEMMFWLWRAALSGHPESQVMLGAVYEYGEPGVIANRTEALKWYLIAARNGSPELAPRARKLADRIRVKMTSVQVATGHWLADEWAMALAVQLAGVYEPEGEIRNIRPSGLSVSK